MQYFNIHFSLSLLGLRLDGEFPSVWVAVPGVVGALLVLGAEHLATAPTGKFPRLVDVLEMSLHGCFSPESFTTIRAGNSFILTGGNPNPRTLELPGRLFLHFYRRHLGNNKP